MDLRPERLERIVQLLNQRGGARTNELAGELGVSAATIRRDLEELAARGSVDRTHGGAVILRSSTAKEAPYEEKALRMHTEKGRIAQRGLDFVPDGATIVLDSGTTVLELARRLIGKPVTVIALDLPSAMALASGEGVEVWTPGGRVRNGLYSLVGPWVEGSLRTLAVDVFFMGADAIDSVGVSNSTVEEAEVKRLAIGCARTTVLLADSSKLGKRSFARVCPLSAIGTLITDEASRAALADIDHESVHVEYV
jgi:DeoR/GlpR family transcriptional regulator of sugar metabolism